MLLIIIQNFGFQDWNYQISQKISVIQMKITFD